jgi:hypothetical protein
MDRRKMMSKFVELELPDLPRGYEYTGYYRVPLPGEFWYANSQVKKYIPALPMPIQEQLLVRKLKWKPSEGEIVWYANLQLIDVRSIKYDSLLMKEGYDRGLLYRTVQGAETALELMLDAISDINFNDEED